MIGTRVWRVRDRSTFARFRAEGRRFRSGQVTLTWLDGRSGEPPRVAYAIGRNVGGAVDRNRLRRRLRAVVAELNPGPGSYLLGVSPAASGLTYEELKAHVNRVFVLAGRRDRQKPQ